MFRLLARIVSGNSTVGYTLLNLDNMTQCNIIAEDVKTLAYFNKIENVKYVKDTHTIASTDKGLRLMELKRIKFNEYNIQFCEKMQMSIPKKDKIQVTGIVFASYDMKACGIRLTVNGKDTLVNLKKYHELIENGKIKSTMLVTNDTDSRINKAHRLVKNQSIYGGTMYRYIIVSNCYKERWSLDEANELFPHNNLVIDYVPSEYIDIKTSDIVNKGLETFTNFVIHKDDLVRIICDVARMTSYREMNTIKYSVAECNSKMFIMPKNYFAISNMKTVRLSNKIVWLKDDYDVYIERKENGDYTVTKL